MENEQDWTVYFSSKSQKQKQQLPNEMSFALEALVRELKTDGPERKNWPHYGKIKGKGKNIDMRHCHLNKRRPIYVVVWVVLDGVMQIVEVRYVGTHENADYRRIG
jgi:mRNA-degrading endonuclease RelE of RelBE toxin-antitoxin system